MKARVQITLILSSLIMFINCTGQPNNKVSTYMIDEILKIENAEEAILELDSKLNEISEYGENIEALSDAEKVVLFIGNLEREINNGGFHQFFLNSSGNYANETLNALKLIGANKTAEIVSHAYAEWPNSNIPSNRMERQNILEEIEDKAEKTWNNCDEQFYNYEEDISSLMLLYVKTNLNEFK